MQFPTIASGGCELLLDPALPGTFERCKLDLTERDTHAQAVALHRDLLRLRRDDVVFSGEALEAIDGAVLAAEAFVLRFFGGDGNDRLLVVNFGVELLLRPLPEPLLAPPASRDWALLWSSEDAAYGGDGTPPAMVSGALHVPAHAALALATRH